MSTSERRSARRAAWQRWEMTRFDAFDAIAAQDSQGSQHAVPSAALAQANLQTHLQVEAELEHRQRQAQEQGYARGYAEGHAEGFQQGVREGQAEGLRQGREEGLAAGFEAGLQDGQKQGQEQGQKEGQQQGQQHAQALQRLAQAAAHALHGLEREVGQALVHLAVSIAERVLHSTLDAHPEKLLDLVREIVCLHGEDDALLTLRVHPSDVERLQQALQQEGGAPRWRLLADATVQAGGCQAQTALGSVDATLQTRWRKVVGMLGVDAQ